MDKDNSNMHGFFEYMIEYFKEHGIDFRNKAVRDIYRDSINSVSSSENIASANIFARTMFGVDAKEFRRNVELIDDIIKYIDRTEDNKDNTEQTHEDTHENIIDMFNTNDDSYVKRIVDEYVDNHIGNILSGLNPSPEDLNTFKEMFIDYTKWILNK